LARDARAAEVDGKEFAVGGQAEKWLVSYLLALALCSCELSASMLVIVFQ
jgi:hypothetical protein